MPLPSLLKWGLTLMIIKTLDIGCFLNIGEWITFPTSYLINNLLEESSFFSANQVIITSASSKTALGLAFLLKKNQKKYGKKIIGITSPKNQKFVEGSGYYDQTISYPDLDKALPKNDAVILDFNGNAELLLKFKVLLKEQLKHISLIGITDWNSSKSYDGIPNTVPFSSGIQGQKLFQKQGLAKATQLVQQEQAEFTQSLQKLITLTYLNNSDNLASFYKKILNGNTNPQYGHLISF